MLRNYLKIAWRNIYRKKIFSSIKIFGLAVAVAVFLAIFQYLKVEISYDRYHQHANSIYRIAVKKYDGKGLAHEDAYTFSALGPVAKEEIPGIKDFFRLSPWANTYTIVYKGAQNTEPISIKTSGAIFADAPYAGYFSLDFITGGADSSLSKPNNIFISNSLAEKYFGRDWHEKLNPVGASLLVYTSNRDSMIPFTVCGVYNDMPVNSHLHYDAILSHSSLVNYLPKEIPEEVRLRIFADNWGNYSWYTYLVLDRNADAATIEAQLNELVAQKKNTGQLQETFFLQPIKDIHLKSHLSNEPSSGGSLLYLYILGGIGLLVLFLAWANYTNLSIAGFLERTHEIGLRKVIGSKKYQVVAQLFVEAFLYNVIAIGLGLVLNRLSSPIFTYFTGHDFGFVSFGASDMYLIFILFGLFLIGSILASLYPSLMVASVKSTDTLKARGLSLSRLNARNPLLVFQFTISIILIMGTLLIYKQIGFMRNQDLGIDTERVLIVEGPNALDQEINFAQTVQKLRDEIGRHPQIGQISATSTVPGKMNVLSRPLFRVSADSEAPKEIKEILIDHQYFSMLNVRLLAGHDFSAISDNNREKVILNESAMRMLGFTSPEEAINKNVGYLWAGGKAECEVIGIVEDFHQHSLKYDKEPIGFYNELYGGDYMVKIQSGQNPSQSMSGAIAMLESRWNELFPNNPFHYYFLDSFFNKQYEADRRFGSIFTLFSALGIFIACLGLIGLSIQSAAKRTKEIGIRKVNGAKVWEVMAMLNKDFIKWVAIAFIIATPIAWYAMNKWLENFAYKTELSWWIFALAGVLALGIALLTVSWQSWKAATRNPVEALRYE